MNIIQSLSSLAVSQFSGKINTNEGVMVNALQKLLPTHNNDLDIGALIELFARNGGNVVSLAMSWLGDDSNLSLDANQLSALLGDNKVSDFSHEVGLNKGEAASVLADIIPQIIDQNSESGMLNLN